MIRKIQQFERYWRMYIRRHCANLSNQERIRVIWILSIIYFIITVLSLVWVFVEYKNSSLTVHHIENPIPVKKDTTHHLK